MRRCLPLHSSAVRRRISANIAKVALVLLLAGLACACRQQTIQSSDVQLDLVFSHTRVGAATARLTVRDKTGKSIENPGSIRLRGDMTHAGMQPVIVEAESSQDGMYELPFEWTMAGDWIVEASLKLASGATVSHSFALSIESESDGMAGMDHGAGGESSALYMRIANGGRDAMVFVDAQADAANRVEFHETIIEHDMARMGQRETLIVPAGGSLHLRPGRLHIMLRELTRTLAAGDVMDFRLIAESGDAVTLSAPIMMMWNEGDESEVTLGDLVFSEVWARPANAGEPNMRMSGRDMHDHASD